MKQSYNLIMYQPEAALLLSSGNPTEKLNVQGNDHTTTISHFKLRWRSGNSDITLHYGTVLGDGSFVLVPQNSPIMQW